MTADFTDAFKVFMNTAYTFFSCFKIPGTDFTPLQMLIGSTIIVISVKLLKNIGGSYDI